MFPTFAFKEKEKFKSESGFTLAIRLLFERGR